MEIRPYSEEYRVVTNIESYLGRAMTEMETEMVIRMRKEYAEFPLMLERMLRDAAMYADLKSSVRQSWIDEVRGSA